jgi:hypothetical protein
MEVANKQLEQELQVRRPACLPAAAAAAAPLVQLAPGQARPVQDSRRDAANADAMPFRPVQTRPAGEFDIEVVDEAEEGPVIEMVGCGSSHLRPAPISRAS